MIRIILSILMLNLALFAKLDYKTNINPKEFLDLNPSYYTINLATLDNFQGVTFFQKNLNQKQKLYMFEFGKPKKKTKVLYGVFAKYDDALKAVEQLSSKLSKNKPYIVKLKKFQELFTKYHIYDVVYPPNSIKDDNVPAFILDKEKFDLEDKLQSKHTINFFDAIDYALYNNPTVQEKIYILKAAQTEIYEQEALFLPKVDISYDKSKKINGYDSTGAALETGGYSQSLTLKWNLFNGMKDYNQYKLKNRKYTSTFFAHKDFINSFIFDFIKAYFEVVRIKEKYKFSVENFKQYQKYMKKIKYKEKYGMVSLLDVTAMRKKYLSSKLNEIEMKEKRYFDALYKLQKYINVEDDTNFLLSLEDIDFDIDKYTLDNLIDIAISSHPLVLQAQSEITLTQMELNKAHSNYMPKLDFIIKKNKTTTNYENRDEVLSDTTFRIQATMNLFNGFEDKNIIKRRITENKQKKYRYQNVLRELRYGLKTNYLEYQVLKKKQSFVQQNLKNAQDAYKAAKYDFKFAKIKEDVVISAMESLKDSHLKNIDLKYDMLISKYKFLFNMGILYDELQKRVNR